MIYKKIKLSDLHPMLKESDAYIETYIYEQNVEYNNFNYQRPSLLIIPGGGYSFVSEREREPIAFRFASEGFNCFTLTYSINKIYPTPHLELAVALHYINTHLKEYFGFDKNCFIMGFSAGGHLAASYGYLYKELGTMLTLNEKLLRPSGIILGYPVITMRKSTHGGTKGIITGNDNKLIEKLSVEEHVSGQYPPTFIWTTSTDTIVPPVNLDLMVEQLKKNNVKYESLVYPYLEHGASICRNSTRMNYGLLTNEEEEVSLWVDKAVKFMLEIVK